MIKKLLRDPIYYGIIGLGKILPDTIAADAFYLKMLFHNRMGKELNLKNPTTYNEKLQWMKLYNRNPEYTTLVDKEAVKQKVAARVGWEYIIPTLGVWDRFEDIDFNELPDQFVLKCTHDSGGLVICTDKKKLDIDEARKKINHALKRKYYLNTREWPYRDVKPRIIAEEYMVDESGYELKDYKFFVFDGEMKAMFIATDRNAVTDTCFDFFDREFNHLPFTNGHPNANHIMRKPDNYDEMIRIAEKLGKGIPQARIDLYNINGRIYFGEITFFHWSGLKPFEPEEWDYTFGSWIKIQ